LEVWKIARDLTKRVYVLTDTFPEPEKYGLTTQIRRCCISIAANIAEGSAKSSNRDFKIYLEISLGSCFELESHLLLSSDLNFCTFSDADTCLNEIIILQKKLHNFIASV